LVLETLEVAINVICGYYKLCLHLVILADYQCPMVVVVPMLRELPMQYGLPMMLVFNNLSGLLMVVVIPMQCGQ
jgi:hypothetical protein